MYSLYSHFAEYRLKFRFQINWTTDVLDEKKTESLLIFELKLGKQIL